MEDMDKALEGCARRSWWAGGGKLFRGRGGVNSALLLAAAAAMGVSGGCMRLSRGVPDVPRGEWETRLGDTRRASFADERVPASVEVEWDVGLGRGLPATPFVHGHLVTAVISGGGIVTADGRDGRRYWSRRFNGAVAGQALRLGGHVVFATHHRDGAVHALDVRTGRNVWRQRPGGRPTSEPAHAEGRLYVATDRGDLVTMDAATGDETARTRIGGPVSQPPLVLGGQLMVLVRDTLVRVDLSSGDVVARLPLGGAASAPLAGGGDTLVVALQGGVVAAYAELGARELWRYELGAPVLAAPVVTPDGVYALTRRAEVYRLDARGAHRLAALDAAATESLTVTANGILTGLLDGTLVFMRRDGTVVWRQELPGSIRAPAAVAGGAVYAGTLRGRLVKLTEGEDP